MTTPNGSVKFNSSTGSDSASSGIGPTSAITGSGAELDGTSTVDVSSDGVSLSSIASGDMLFCDTSTGRKFSIIASVDTASGTITTDDVWGTESAISWAVGGKRATLQNSQDLWTITHGAAKQTLELETDQVMTTYVTSYADKGGKLVSSVPGTLRTLTFASRISTGGGWQAKDIHFKSTSNGKLGEANTGVQSSSWFLVDCIVGDATNQLGVLGSSHSRTFTITAYNTIFQNNSATPFNAFNADLYYCLIRDMPTIKTFYAYSLGGASHRARNCIFDNIHSLSYQRRSGATNIQNCIISNVPSQVFSWSDNPPGTVRNNIFSNTGTISNWSSSAFFGNAYYNVTAPTQETDGTILTSDPFKDSSTGDFTLNNDSGGGQSLRSSTNALGNTIINKFNWLTDGSDGSGSKFHPLAQ